MPTVLNIKNLRHGGDCSTCLKNNGRNCDFCAYEDITQVQLELNQYRNFDGEIITLENDFDFDPANALEESETENGEPCYRFAVDEEDSIWLDGDGNEVTEYLSA